VSGVPGSPLRVADLGRLLSEHIRDGVLIQDDCARILWCNPSYCRITGYSAEEIIGQKPQSFILPPDRRPSPDEIAAFSYDKTDTLFQRFEVVQNQRKSGELFWAQLSFGFFETVDGERVVVTVRDVTEEMAATEALSQSKSALERAVNFDALTGLANRRKLMEFLGQRLREAGPDAPRVGVLHLDLDRFKHINDTFGHAAGDAVIQAAAAAMKRQSGPKGMAARVGGDEFVVAHVLDGDAEDLSQCADRLIADAETPVIWEGRSVTYGFSIGIAVSEPGATSGTELIRNADFALYEAKARGRGCWVMYDDVLQRKHRSRAGMAEDLARTVNAHGLEFSYQPIVDLIKGRVVGIETLARWHHPVRGRIEPHEFLPIAEELGILDRLDGAAMKAAALALKRVEALGFSDTYLSFNASTRSLSDPALYEDMVWTAAELGIAPHLLAVEVLETAFFAPDQTETHVAAGIRQVRDAGFQTFLDDFGTGYAGLAHLGKMDVSGLKIDGSLVRNTLESEAGAVIVRAILNLARDLGLDVVAEGVETAEMAAHLQESGCAYVQGFHIAHPMSLDRLESWLLAFLQAPARAHNA